MRENISGKKKKILLVEDSRLTAMVLAELLHKNGYDVENVATGEEAVEKIMGGVTLDLVLMDIELAGEMSGIAAARRIIKSRDIPVVFLTANTSGGIIEKIKEVKAYGFVLKGTDKAALLSTVEMALKLHEANIHARMFERLFENSLNELYIFHPESLKFVAVNRAARKNLGYTTEEMNVMTPLDLNLEFNMESFRRLLAPLVSEEQEQVLFNTVHRRKDGSLYPVEINIQLFDYEGAKLCMALVVNLTERIAMEEELKEKDTTIRAIMDSARDAIIMLDGQGKVIFWNPAAEQFFGYSREEVLGKDLHRLVVLDERLYQIYTQAFQHFQLTGEGNAIGKTIEMKAKHKDGREFDVEISMSALRSRDAWHAVGIVRDISERKQAQEELENSRKQYIELAEEAPIGILKCDLEGNIVYVNQKTLEILGSPSIEETKKINLLTFPLLVRYGLSRKLEECINVKIILYDCANIFMYNCAK
ncbi:PAS domain S-box protein, partial [Clostridium prolinivorans]|uniref:PAS domain S-box protein n=1 Tax=Clostridium prolinivorans TaxID=2769420 RepID=UPI000FDC095E